MKMGARPLDFFYTLGIMIINLACQLSLLEGKEPVNTIGSIVDSAPAILRPWSGNSTKWRVPSEF